MSENKKLYLFLFMAQVVHKKKEENDQVHVRTGLVESDTEQNAENRVFAEYAHLMSQGEEWRSQGCNIYVENVDNIGVLK